MPKLSDHRNLRILSIATLVTVLLLTCIHGAAANQAQSPELLPFGIAVGDVRGPTCDDCTSGPVTLYVPFTFIGTEYRQIYVNSNGVLSFEHSFTSCCPQAFPRSSPPLVAPFWHDFNPRVGGNIYYRQTNDSQLLQLYHTRLRCALVTKDQGNFFPTLLFIATWDQVARFGGSAQVNNTLQVVLATDEVQTVAVFIYKDINWGQRAQIGFNVGDGYTAFVFPEALSNRTLDMDESSNAGKLGVYVHRIDNSPVLLPFGIAVGDVRGPTCDDCTSGPVNLSIPFTFIGTEYRQIYVNSNGLLSFEDSFISHNPQAFPLSSPPLVAPFWHDFNPGVGGNIYYRQTNDSQLLQLYHTRLSTALASKDLDNFFPTLLFIATWDQVAQYLGSAQLNNTLQVVLATDEVQTVAVFIYKDINWGQGAQIGFNVGDGYTAFVFPEALSDQTLNMDESSNVGKLGVYIHRINKPPLLKLSGIIPFGVNASDVPGPLGDDSSSKPLTLRVPFPFFGREYNTIIVNSNGILSFNTPFTSCCPPRDFPMVSPPLIAPFWLDFDLTDTNESGIYYRQTNDSIYLEFIHTLLMNASVGGLVDFFPTQLFIATWDKVPQYQNSGSTEHNTFQVLLSTDGNQTVSIFIYHQVRWGLGAQIGFNAGDGYTSFTFPEALSDQTLSIDQHSNIGEPGVFVYRIDVPPDQAHTLTVESSESTSISISWRPPTLTSLQVLYYIISAVKLNSTVGDNNIITQVNTTSNVVLYNVTGLLPGTTYELTVVAVSLDIYRPETGASMSQPSSSLMTTTGFTVPSLSCDAPVSSNGVTTVTWSYIHTGGLPLTNIFLTYTNSILGNSTRNFSNRFQLNMISVNGVDSTSIVVPNLVTGAEYIFNVTTENSYGSSSIICGPIPHLIGLPTTPVIDEQMSGPNGGEITISLMTSSSGINGQSSDSEVFWFVVTPVHEGIGGESISHLSMNYQSGSIERVVISGLEEGESYALNVTAVNVYGSSQVATSMSIAAGRSATITGAVIGGAVGVGIILLLVIVLLLVLILILMKVLVVRRGKTEIGNVESVLMNRVASVRIKRSDHDLESEAVYEEPGSLLRHIQPVSLKNSDGSMLQLEDCPAYGASTFAIK